MRLAAPQTAQECIRLLEANSAALGAAREWVLGFWSGCKKGFGLQRLGKCNQPTARARTIVRLGGTLLCKDASLDPKPERLRAALILQLGGGLGFAHPRSAPFA